MWSLTTALLLIILQTADYNAEGLKALEAQQYDSAAELFTKAVEADSEDYGAIFHLALANSLMGKDAEAIAGYKKVLEIKPGIFEAELNLGILLLRQKQPKEAVPYLQAAAEKKPKEFRPAMFLAEALLESREYARSEQAFVAATEIDPASAIAQLGLARAIAEQGRIQDAEPHFRKAAELDATYKDALLELAMLQEKNGRPADAITIYAGFPENVGARERLGALLIETGRPAEAIPHLQWILAKAPSSAARLALAMAYTKNKQPEKAAPVLREAIDDEPGNAELRLFYGRSLRDQKDYAGAARQFLQVVQAKPNSVEGWNELAAMLISLEQHPQALAALDRVKALGGESVGHYYLRAITLDKMQNYEGALANYERFLAESQGKHPEEEFKARQRIRVVKKELERR